MLNRVHAASRLVGTTPALLELDGVSWGPRASRPILEPVSLAVAPGEMLAIVGPNGAGKSSLLRCLYRYHKPISGTVRLDGTDIWKMKPRDCARRIATVLQESASDFGLTVAEIVELGLTPHVTSFGTGDDDYDHVEAALDLLGLTALAARDFNSLSGGEKQRVMIARALVQRPDLLILDEPTNHLDIRHQLEVLELLGNLGCTVIVSLHDLALASAHADRVLVMDAGRAVACGAPADILTPERIRQSFSVGATLDDHPVTGRPRFSFHLER
ncbi:ABC transporter ATP-binding protein [Aminobacter aganoensis]|uniref:Iron complex transport system ATP-binding protein n=1 Tax=Aminobacter aganoensis TaxID=83264 RepID=A0A7X0FDE6_9HYPH|nr:ABC transporter ATP-binding protein [Aminobacter aganoensis]MBB6357383.1 iron complex transport system ATP-binding protein [Aminobacter aganoensis]